MPDHLDTGNEVFTITKTFTGAVPGWGPVVSEQFAQLVGAAGALSRRSSASSFAVARSSAVDSFVARGRALSYELGLLPKAAAHRLLRSRLSRPIWSATCIHGSNSPDMRPLAGPTVATTPVGGLGSDLRTTSGNLRFEIRF